MTWDSIPLELKIKHRSDFPEVFRLIYIFINRVTSKVGAITFD